MRREQTIIESDFRAEQTAGFCAMCNKFVPRDEDARCAVAGHLPEHVSGIIELDAQGKIPFEMPKFNWGAALMPPVWGPIHGVLIAAVVLPVIVFANNNFSNALNLPAEASTFLHVLMWAVTSFIILGTGAFCYYFGSRGWGIAWNKDSISSEPLVTREIFDKFVKRERLWTILSAVLFVGFVFLVVTFWL